jgi:hypothetical protein
VGKTQQLHIHSHQEHEHICGKGCRIAGAGVGMELVHLHPLQLGQGSSGLVETVELIATAAEAAH